MLYFYSYFTEPICGHHGTDCAGLKGLLSSSGKDLSYLYELNVNMILFFLK